jgi:hypothetical protein
LTEPGGVGHDRGMGFRLCAPGSSLAVAAFGFTLAVVGCGRTGKSDGAVATATGGSGAAAAGTGNTSGRSGASPTPEGGAGGAGGAGGEDAALAPGASELRRLTAAEYEATVSDVLGTSVEPNLDAFATEVGGFDNNAEANHVTDELYLRYLQTAEDVADDVFASDVLRPQIVTCNQVDDAACVQSVITQNALKLFRRPALAEELVSYQKVYERARTRGEDHEGALEEVLIALLASAEFLYRMEFVPTAIGTQPIGPYDMATRLSYLLWSSAPDASLLDAAAKDALSTDEQLAAAVERLLKDPKSKRLGENFAGQWLGARRLATRTFDAELFPSWSPLVSTAAASELEAFFTELLQPDQDVARFLDSPVHFVNEELGQLYGLNVAHIDNQRVELKGVDRQGFLGLVGFLAQTSMSSRTSPTLRGSWILDRLLCSPVPPPPADLQGFSGNEDALGDYLRGLDAMPGCAGCHTTMDRLGLALESYDGIGRYRTTYASKKPVDAHVSLPASSALPAAMDVSGTAGLSRLLASAPAFKACVAQKLYTYGFGRTVADDERANVQALAEGWQSGPTTLRELILRLVQSRDFRFRSDGGKL